MASDEFYNQSMNEISLDPDRDIPNQLCDMKSELRCIKECLLRGEPLRISEILNVLIENQGRLIDICSSLVIEG